MRLARLIVLLAKVPGFERSPVTGQLYPQTCNETCTDALRKHMRLGLPTRPDLTPLCMEGQGAAALVGRSFHEVNKKDSCHL